MMSTLDEFPYTPKFFVLKDVVHMLGFKLTDQFSMSWVQNNIDVPLQKPEKKEPTEVLFNVNFHSNIAQ